MEGEWNNDEELSNIRVEEPSASLLPCSVRFRAFTDSADNSNAREAAWETASWNSFGVHKRRRIGDVPCFESEDVVQPLLRVLKDPIDVARRRFETLRWFEKPRTGDEIYARFLLDRQLGVTPSLATLQRALLRLKHLHCVEAIVDLAEDIAMDLPTFSIWTLLHIVDGLKGQPQRAARLAFSLAPLLTNGAVPTSVWSSLCCELDKEARQMPAPLDRSFVELFGQVLFRARDDGPVSGSIVVYYGQALLKSRAPLRSIVGLVQTELLSGRNTLPTDTVSELRLSAFLSDLIEVMCSNHNDADGREEGLPLSGKERLLHCSDLLKHAYAGRYRLTQAAFDAFLHLCDEEQDYHRLCIVFLAMCTLSTPTLLSTTRVAEVLCDMEEMSHNIATLLRQPSPSLLLYVLLRYGGGSLFSDKNRYMKGVTSTSKSTYESGCCNRTINTNREPLETYLFECLALLCARDGSASLCMNVFAAAIDLGGPVGARTFICTLAANMSPPLQLFGGRETAVNIAAALEPFNLEALYYSLFLDIESSVSLETFRSSSRTWQLSSLFTIRNGFDTSGSGITLECGLSNLFSSPQVYGTVLDETALCSLAENAELAIAFEKMMTSYALKTGAVSLLHFGVCTAKCVSFSARQLLQRWLMQHNWLTVLPLSLTVQLPSTSQLKHDRSVTPSSLLSLQLFHAVRSLGNTKVAFVSAAPYIDEAAKSNGVQPVITLKDLAHRLGIS